MCCFDKVLIFINHQKFALEPDPWEERISCTVVTKNFNANKSQTSVNLVKVIRIECNKNFLVKSVLLLLFTDEQFQYK